jgi:hypothetical protein
VRTTAVANPGAQCKIKKTRIKNKNHKNTTRTNISCKNWFRKAMAHTDFMMDEVCCFIVSSPDRTRRRPAAERKPLKMAVFFKKKKNHNNFFGASIGKRAWPPALPR